MPIAFVTYAVMEVRLCILPTSFHTQMAAATVAPTSSFVTLQGTTRLRIAMPMRRPFEAIVGAKPSNPLQQHLCNALQDPLTRLPHKASHRLPHSARRPPQIAHRHFRLTVTRNQCQLARSSALYAASLVQDCFYMGHSTSTTPEHLIVSKSIFTVADHRTAHSTGSNHVC